MRAYVRINFLLIEWFTWGWNEIPAQCKGCFYVKDNVITQRKLDLNIFSSNQSIHGQTNKMELLATQRVVMLKQFEIKLNP